MAVLEIKCSKSDWLGLIFSVESLDLVFQSVCNFYLRKRNIMQYHKQDVEVFTLGCR